MCIQICRLSEPWMYNLLKAHIGNTFQVLVTVVCLWAFLFWLVFVKALYLVSETLTVAGFSFMFAVKLKMWCVSLSLTRLLTFICI